MTESVMPMESITEAIRMVRGVRVILDEDLARMYGVETYALTRAVQRNRDRFPSDFMLHLDLREVANLNHQFGGSSFEHGGRRKGALAFTEQGVAMLSSVLRSPRAVAVNIEIMRAFVRLRQLLASNHELARKLDALEKKYDAQFKSVFDAIRALMTPSTANPKKIGF